MSFIWMENSRRTKRNNRVGFDFGATLSTVQVRSDERDRSAVRLEVGDAKKAA